ncbi:hypothetical protein Tco_1190528 [Tanacetum coccineum]
MSKKYVTEFTGQVIRGKSARNDLGSRLSGTYIFAQSTLSVPKLIGETLEAAKQCDLWLLLETLWKLVKRREVRNKKFVMPLGRMLYGTSV